MSDEAKRGIVFRDPVHQLIHIDDDDDFLCELIDSRPMQRLRRVRQLGVSWLTYHGAEHSRFSHSMGVFHVASRILETLTHRYQNSEEIQKLIKNNRRAVLAAALLHDIGHAPFSHAMERLFSANADHEKRTMLLIQDESLGIPEILEKVGVQAEDVVSILEKLHKYRFLCDIVSSQLDADRMDYLLRDSLFTGVEYGHYDLEWVSSHLCLGKRPHSEESEGEMENTNLRLCLDEKRGLFAAEQLIIGRYHMSMQVYFHAATRMWEALLLCLLRRAAELSRDDSPTLPGVALLPDTSPALLEFLQKEGSISNLQFLRLDDGVISSAMENWRDSSDDFVAEVSSAFLERKKRIGPDKEKLFKMYDLSGKDLLDIGRLLGRLEKETEKFPAYKWELDDIKKWPLYKDFLSNIKKSGTVENVSDASSIFLSDGDLSSDAQPAELSSFIFQSMGDNPLDVTRLFVHYTLAEEIDSLMDEFKLS